LHPLIRPRRNRKNPITRHWLKESQLSRHNLVYPVFVVDGEKQKQSIDSLPGQFRWSVDQLLPLCEQSLKLGVKSWALFPAINQSLKDSKATEALNPEGLVCRTIQEIKKRFPELVLITDIALDPYSSDGHDGLVKDGVVLNDPSVEILAQMALLHAQAGADIVAPSDMMDGRVLAIREILEENNYTDVQIISYCAKYASSFYGPFREALDSAPKEGDKKTYQMDPANRKEALLEVELDQSEGADILMVKPALSYLDVIAEVKKQSLLPVACYNVSGEYAMIKAAAVQGWIDETQVVNEVLLSMRRAGADVIFTYFAMDANLDIG
jgi:porphobilinogen synthase